MAEQASGRGGVGGRRFHIHACLGRGGFGEVYRATMTSSGGVRTEVAVKILREDIDPGSEALKRLRDEGRLLGALRHPAILRVHDLVLLEGRVALVTEYVEGEDLDGCLAAEPPLPLRSLMGVVGEVAAALHAAWTSPAPDGDELVNLVHRDVKPANIRIGRHGEVKLLDFGIARATNVAREAQTANNAMMGSYLYMAPERFHEDAVFPPSDIYALGCVLFEGLAGHRFFEDKTLKQIYGTMLSMKKFRKHRDKRFELLPEELPEDVTALLRQMLEPDPESRPSAAEVARRCDDLVEDLAGPTLKRWARRRTWPSPQQESGWLEGRDLSAHSFASNGGHTPRTAEETWVHDPDGEAPAPPEPDAPAEMAPPPSDRGNLPPLNMMALPSPGGHTALDAPIPRLATDEVPRPQPDAVEEEAPEPPAPEPEPEPEPPAPEPEPEPEPEPPAPDDDLPGLDEIASALGDDEEPEPQPEVLAEDFAASEPAPMSGPTAVPLPDRGPTYTPPVSKPPSAPSPPPPSPAPPRATPPPPVPDPLPLSDQATGPPAAGRASGPPAASQRSMADAGYIPIDQKRTPEPIPGVMEDEPPPPLYQADDDIEELIRQRARERNRRIVIGGVLGLFVLVGGGVIGWAVVDGQSLESLAELPARLTAEPQPDEGLTPVGVATGGGDEGTEAVEPEPEPAAVEPEPKPAPPPKPPPKPAPVKPKPPPKPTGPSASGLRAAGWGKVDADPSAAADLFRRSLALDPGSADGHYGLGYALLQLGRSAEATDPLCTAQKTGDTEIKRDVRSLLSRNGLSCD